MTISGTLPKQAGDPTSPAVEPNQETPDISPFGRGDLIKPALILTPSQVDEMTRRALVRIDELSFQMGLYTDGTGFVDPHSWMGIRQRNQYQYDNDWRWRATMGGIFAYSNFSLNVAKRYSRLISAKCRDDLVGTDPFFAIMPEDSLDRDVELSKSSEKYLQLKVRHSNTKEQLAMGLKTALIRNEQVMKITYVSNSTKFKGPARVGIGPFVYQGPYGPVYAAENNPIVTPRGAYIYEHDEWIPDPAVEGQFRLKKEPNVAIQHVPEFQDFDRLDQIMTHQEGVDVRCCDWRDFLCPLTAADIHEADICVHLFDEQWERIIATYGAFEQSAGYVNQPYMTGEKSANEAKGELQGAIDGQQISSMVLKIVNAADVYMRADVDDDGMEEEVWMILDRRTRKCIWYDYLGAHLKKRPFEVIPGIEFVPNRWYGTGVFEMLEHKQLYIDTQFNRVNFKSSKSSSVRFRNKNAVAQWMADQDLIFGDDQVLDIVDPTFNAQRPPLFQVQLTDIDEHAMNLIELMLQASSTEVGITAPNDADMAGLDTSKLATGIKSMERTANVLMKETAGAQGDAVAKVLDQVVDCTLEHMDPTEVLYDEDTAALVSLNREDIRALGRHTRLLLTRSRSTETIETARMVVQLCREYYEALTPEEQNLLRDEYVRQLRALEVQDADKLLRKVSDDEVAAWKEQRAQAAQLPPKTSIATKYPDLLRSEQVQLLTREGIQPGSAEEFAAQQQEELANEAAKTQMDAEKHQQDMAHSEEKHQTSMRQTQERAAVNARTAAARTPPQRRGGAAPSR